MIFFGGVFLWMSFAMSSKESRAEARKRHHPADKMIGAAALAILLLLFL